MLTRERAYTQHPLLDLDRLVLVLKAKRLVLHGLRQKRHVHVSAAPNDGRCLPTSAEIATSAESHLPSSWPPPSPSPPASLEPWLLLVMLKVLVWSARMARPAAEALGRREVMSIVALRPIFGGSCLHAPSAHQASLQGGRCASAYEHAPRMPQRSSCVNHTGALASGRQAKGRPHACMALFSLATCEVAWQNSNSVCSMWLLVSSQCLLVCAGYPSAPVVPKPALCAPTQLCLRF